MALQECGLNVNKSGKELQPHGSLGFPCAGYDTRYGGDWEDGFPWHWHEELEIISIEEGQMEVRVPSQTFLLEAGDMLAINSNILHFGKGSCRLRSFVFSPALVSGRDGQVFGQKYIEPLVGCRRFRGCLMMAGSQSELPAVFQRAFEALAREDVGFEFTVREGLSRICLALYQTLAPQEENGNYPAGEDNLRIQKMLAFIHSHYGGDVTLGDIAGAADISQRECLRCFQKTIQLSPIQYLLKYRVMQGAEQLRKTPGDSVSEISARCGFDSPSNFTKTFKRFYRCTPREYRNRG